MHVCVYQILVIFNAFIYILVKEINMASTDKSNEFITTTPFKTKLNYQQKKLHLEIQKDFLNDLKSLIECECDDVNIHIAEEDIHLRHRCIINAICPLLNNLDTNEDSNEPICLDKYPDTIQQYEKKIFKYIYSPKHEETVNEINTEIDFSSLLNDGSFADVTFTIQGKQFKCHKCILSCRCEYFAKMFSGNWKEKEQDVIELKDVSCGTFSYVLSFLYTGLINIPKEVDLTELLYISDMYNIQGIKLVALLHIKAFLCHFFLVPCEVCITGVIKALELSQIFSLTELTDKCYDWFIKNYVKIFSSRYFSKSSQQIKNDIKEKIRASISNITVIRHLKDCNKLKSCLPTVKWAHSMKTLIEELEEHCLEFVCNNFESVINEPSFQYCLFNDKNISYTLMLQGIFITAVSKHIAKDNCIDIYKCTLSIECMRANFEHNSIAVINENEAIDNCKQFIVDIQNVCKKCIGKNIFHIQKMKKWKNLSKELKDHLMAVSGFIPIEETGN